MKINYSLMKISYILLFMLLTWNLSAAPPTVPSSNVSFAVNGASFNISWTAGNGTRRIVIVKAGSPVTAIPQNGIDYTANEIFGSGQEIAPGEFVVYDGASASGFAEGLTPATHYYFAFFEYNGSGATTEYLTSSFLASDAFTSAAPTMQATGVTFSNITGNTVLATIAVGNGERRLILAREGSPVNADPTDLIPYGASATFGNGTQVGTGNFSVYSSNDNSTTIYGLKPGTQYYFAVYEYNGLSEPVYKKPAFTTSVTTRAVPTIASTGVSATKIDGQELTLGWTSGNGLRRIIVAREGSDVTAVPVDGVDYNGDAVFGNGTAIAPGQFVVYDDNFNATIVRGLNPATTYYFRIYEYDGTGNATIYLTTLFGSASSSTAVTPTEQASNLAATNITGNSLNLTWTPGNGRGNFVVARAEAPVNIVPADLTAYTANSSFGEGQQIGSGNFVLGYEVDGGIIVTNLVPNTTYYFSVFEFNGFDQPLYLSPAATFSVAAAGPVPVKLSQWKATASHLNIQLQWTTLFEKNSSYFNILRSVDGVHFEQLLRVAAKGNSQLPVQYSAEDINPAAGYSYYKLEMADIDGHTEYSPVIKVSFAAATHSFSIRSNPVHDNLQVDFAEGIANNKSEWRIINEKGQHIINGFISSPTLKISTSSLPAGIYWFQLQSKTNKESKVFVKQ